MEVDRSGINPVGVNAANVWDDECRDLTEGTQSFETFIVGGYIGKNERAGRVNPGLADEAVTPKRPLFFIQYIACSRV